MTAGKFVSFEDLEKDVQELISKSIEARIMAYAPYSSFKVGAALRCDDETIIPGCNVENSSYPVGICAERVAISSAISLGKRTYRGLAIAADPVNGIITSPCGMCRQFLSEFGDQPIYLTTPTMSQILKTSVAELLPLSFQF